MDNADNTNDQNNIDAMIEALKPKNKQMLDVLYSSNNCITDVHSLKRLLFQSISSPAYLAGLSPEDWAKVMGALNESERVTGMFVNEQAKLAMTKDSPAPVQNVFNLLAGQANVQHITQQQPDQVQGETSYQIPTDILPIQQALTASLDQRFNIDRTAAVEEYEGTASDAEVIDINDITTNTDTNSDTSSGS